MSLDRAAELNRLDDLWPEIHKRIGTTGFVDAELEAKFRKGEAEHGRDWLRMTREDLEHAIQEELMDMILYRCMIEARWPDQTQPFFQYRDLGDESDGDEDVSGVPA